MTIEEKLERDVNLKTAYETDPLSYKVIKNLLYDWRRSGTRSSEFNEFDVPGHLFFKVMFHFWNGDAYNVDVAEANHNGLLTPSWLLSEANDGQSDIQSGSLAIEESRQSEEQGQMGDNYDPRKLKEIALTQNCAYNFLLRNDELERAELLRQFITLLSNISTYSPWYFAEISGLDAIMERPLKYNEDFKIEDPKQITIKCLPDSQDNRISTLLDLYRAIVYSHVWHKEILPANLRKFDMSIYIFSSPVYNLHSKHGAPGATMKMGGRDDRANQDADKWFASYKCIELHDCEIDYNAVKSGYSTLSNADGFVQEFSIPISVGDAFEQSYNPYIDRVIGDAITIDIVRNTYSPDGSINNVFTDEEQKDNVQVLNDFKERLYRDNTGTTKYHYLFGNIFNATLWDAAVNINRLTQGRLLNNDNARQAIQWINNGWSYGTNTSNNIFPNTGQNNNGWSYGTNTSNNIFK